MLKKMPVDEGIAFNSAHHSRLPNLQRGPWMHVFGWYVSGVLVAVAFWHNTSARGLPQDWLELRRMAICDEAPRFTASKMLGKMRRWLSANTNATRLISYQDVQVHTGTIYKASGWTPTYISRPRLRDRSKPRAGTSRQYRTDSNGGAPASAAKVRWELSLIGEELKPLTQLQIDGASKMRATK